MEFIASFLGRNGFLPHGYCFTWTPALLWTMVTSDALIAAAYFSIPVAILSFVRKRREPSLWPVAWLFSAFIFACGISHVLDVWTIWQPDYGAQALSKMVTAGVSVVTAVALWPLLPKALRIPSSAQLHGVIASLEAEVNKRRSAEESLAEVQQTLAVTLASIGAGYIATDRAGRVTRMNAVAEQVMGSTQADAQGQSLWRVFQREDRPADFLDANPVDLVIERRLEPAVAHNFVAMAPGGQRTEIEAHVGLMQGDDASVRGVVLVFRDMSRLLQAEAESSRLAALVESSYDAIIGKTLDGTITSWNRAAESLFGYTADEALGRPVQMLIPPERIDEEMRILTELAHGARVQALDTVRLAKDGRRVEVSVTISPIRDARGRIVGASKIARDVSLQRRAEAALRDSEARLRFTLESEQIGDWDLDLATGVGSRSPWHDRCFGYEAYSGEWTTPVFLEHVHADDRAAVAESLRRAVDAAAKWRCEFRVVWPDGSLHWLSAHGTCLLQGGRAVRMLGIVTEVTQQKLAEATRLRAQRLEAENRQILEASRMKSLFLANMSHELRTPLNAVIGFADLLHSGAVPADAPRHRLFLGHIASSGRHLLQLINDVLDLSKVESGKFEFQPEAVTLSALVNEVGDVLQADMLRKQIELTVDVDPAVEALHIDPARLRQVLYNYLSNAIKFSHPGGRVAVRATPEGPAHFRLEVEDGGIGIAEADLPRLFIEFQQLDAGAAKQHQGTGLGLALTRQLVQTQGGSVGVRSRPGVGSVFHLVLARVHQPGVPPPALQPPPLSGGPRLLVIEDESASDGGPRLAALLDLGLGGAGFRVDVASNSERARQLAGQQRYDAITLDLRPPGEPGLEVLAGLRAETADGRHAVPVRGVTMPGGDERNAVFSIADVLSKPLRSDEVLAAMQGLRGAGGAPPRVMVVDDDPLARELMAATLATVGIDAVLLAGGRQALDEIDRHRPDAVVLDLMMPGFDGFATLEALRSLPRWRDTPVYIWTSMLLTDDEYASLGRSARAVLAKGGGGVGTLVGALRRWRALELATPLQEAP